MVFWGLVFSHAASRFLSQDAEKPVFAIRVGNFKLIYGNVGVADVIPDSEWPCADCCPLKRPPLPHLTPSTKADICANARGAIESVDELTAGERGLGATTHSTSLADSPCTQAIPCLYDVVNDPTESTNLASSSAHQAVLAQLRARIAYHAPRTFDRAIDHSNYTAAQYCQIVKGELPAVSKGTWLVGPIVTVSNLSFNCAELDGWADAQARGAAFSYRRSKLAAIVLT